MTTARKHGDLVEQLELGSLSISVRHSCVRRDVYDLRSKLPLSASLRDTLAGQGNVRGGDALYVVEVEGVHQVTVAPAAGRVVVMPRLDTERPGQRAAVLALAALIIDAR